MLIQNQSILRLEAPCSLRDQPGWLPREDTSAACMAQPSFLVAPDSSGHPVLFGAPLYPQLIKRTNWTRCVFSGQAPVTGTTGQPVDPQTQREEFTLRAGEVNEQAQASAAVALAYHRSAVRWNSQARSSSEKAEKIAS